MLLRIASRTIYGLTKIMIIVTLEFILFEFFKTVLANIIYRWNWHFVVLIGWFLKILLGCWSRVWEKSKGRRSSFSALILLCMDFMDFVNFWERIIVTIVFLLISIGCVLLISSWSLIRCGLVILSVCFTLLCLMLSLIRRLGRFA